MINQSFGWARRVFLSRLGAGIAGIGGGLGEGSRLAQAQIAPASAAKSWQPARHAEDDWLDQASARHRMLFDTTSPAALGVALLFASNYLTASRTGYGLADSDLSVVLCLRHKSTPFAYTDAMWAKYGGPISTRAGFTDPRTNQAPKVNAYQAGDYGALLPNNGITLDSLIKRGVRLAVCQMSTRAYATIIAGATSGNAEAIYKDLADHLVPNARLVPAGIVAVNRAQEHGFSVAFTG
jgi:intracellular sulfur oxidation DsrE/DsrF family protein